MFSVLWGAISITNLVPLYGTYGTQYKQYKDKQGFVEVMFSECPIYITSTKVNNSGWYVRLFIYHILGK